MTALATTGGFGIDAFGRHEFGNRKSDVEPRFEYSVPNDGQHNIPVTQHLKFDIYCFSSHVALADLRLFVSEDGGALFAQIYDGSSFTAPYSGRIRRADGQRVVVYLSRATVWPHNRKIVIRCSVADEFGNGASKVAPRKWAT